MVMVVVLLPPRRRALLARATPRVVVGHQKHLISAARNTKKIISKPKPTEQTTLRPSHDDRRRNSFFETAPHVVRFALNLDPRSHSVYIRAGCGDRHSGDLVY